MALLRVVVSGGPGAGKTSLLQSLRVQGHAVGDDAARAIIRERKAAGLPPRPDPLAFAEAVMQRDVATYESAASPSGVVFFERSIVDALGMLDDAARLDAEELDVRLARHPYHHDVFVLPPWEAIYAHDDERDHPFAHAVRVHEHITRWYARCGYRVVEVPCMSLARRCAFVLTALGLGGSG
ncbi:MAG TPA: AAA family ATPase [Burkholderiaceae bacterium]